MTSTVPSIPAPIRATAPDPLTERSRRTWAAGDYDRVSAGFRHEARAFIERRQLTPADRVLDAACGSGNLTIPAAQAGASVTGLDLVPALLDHARAWAGRAQLDITFDEGNVEALPYPSASFDVVLSMFGVMFAARPEAVAAELARVTRPGGRLALANWTRDGFIGQLLGIHGRYAPPPAGLKSPILWGDPDVLHSLLPSSHWSLHLQPRTLTFRYPHSPQGVAELFRSTYGPTVRTFEAIGVDEQAELAGALTTHWVRHHRSVEGGSEIDSTYLEVVATRR